MSHQSRQYCMKMPNETAVASIDNPVAEAIVSQ